MTAVRKLAEKSYAASADDLVAIQNIVREMLAKRDVVRAPAVNEDLRDAGLTSLDMVELVLAVESAFDLQIPESLITPANFQSIAAIGTVVEGLHR
jgi:acyl carrier protein